MDSDMCACTEPLVNEWLNRYGQIVESRTLTDTTGDSDAADFLNDPNAIAWRIVCPCCGRIYARG